MLWDLLKKIAESLEQQNIDYMVIGGQAVLLYGQPRLTQDIDITLGIGPDRLSDILKIIDKLKWRILVNNIEDFVQQTMVLPVEDPNSEIRFDIIFSISAYEQEALRRVRIIALDQTKIRFASPEDLIIHKMIAGRPRDLEDIQGILIKQTDLDREYIMHWLKQFEETLSQPLFKSFEQLWKESN